MPSGGLGWDPSSISVPYESVTTYKTNTAPNKRCPTCTVQVRNALNISELHQPSQLLYTIDKKTGASISHVKRVTCQ